MSENLPVIVRVTKTFAASAERVFDAWLDPAQIAGWMMGSVIRDEEIIHLKTDPQVGGKFSFCVRRGNTEVDHAGEYRELDRPRRLVFTWGISGESANESTVFIEIAGAKAGCELTLTHEMDPKWLEYAERTKTGWTTMLEALGRFLA